MARWNHKELFGLLCPAHHFPAEVTEDQRGKKTWAVMQKRGQLWSVGLQKTEGGRVGERSEKVDLNDSFVSSFQILTPVILCPCLAVQDLQFNAEQKGK